jgi:two-component SAPR family response regulator
VTWSCCFISHCEKAHDFRRGLFAGDLLVAPLQKARLARSITSSASSTVSP